MSDSTQTHNNDIVYIPHSQLYVGSRNIRKVKPDKTADRQLVDNIRAVGLLQNLVVISGTDDRAGQYEVIAGGRRYRALAALIKSGDIAAEHSCLPGSG